MKRSHKTKMVDELYTKAENNYAAFSTAHFLFYKKNFNLVKVKKEMAAIASIFLFEQKNPENLLLNVYTIKRCQ